MSPTDLRIFEVSNCTVVDDLYTGESYPRVLTTKEEEDRHNMVLTMTYVFLFCKLTLQREVARELSSQLETHAEPQCSIMTGLIMTHYHLPGDFQLTGVN
jgi:hypothetical protein